MSAVPRQTHPLLWPSTAVPAWLHPTGRTYLQARGLSQAEAETYQLYFCPDGFWHDRILIPVFRDGDLVAFQGRTVVSAEPRYRTAGSRPLYRPADLPEQSRVFVVEGPFDVWSLRRVGQHAVASLGIFLSDAQKRELQALIQRVNPPDVVIWFDPDVHAQQAAFGLQLLMNRIVPTQVWVFPHIKDPGSLSDAELRDVLQDVCRSGGQPRCTGRASNAGREGQV